MVSLKDAKKLRYGQILYHKKNRNADGTAQRWRVSGKIKTWKRDKKRIEIPVKHGMYSYDRITSGVLHLLTLKEPKRKKPKKIRGR